MVRPQPPHTYWRTLRPDPLQAVYLLFLREDGPSGTALLIDADVLLAHKLTHPHGIGVFDLLTRSPSRKAGDLVFLSDITAELEAAGLDWELVGIEVEGVCAEIAELGEHGELAVLELQGLSPAEEALIANGPRAALSHLSSQGTPTSLPASWSQQLRTKIQEHVGALDVTSRRSRRRTQR
jgi:hypothetical protein